MTGIVYKMFTDTDMDVIYESLYVKDIKEYYNLRLYDDNSLQSMTAMMKIKYSLYLRHLLQEPSMIGNMKYVSDNKKEWLDLLIGIKKCNYVPDSIMEMTNRVLRMLENNKIHCYKINDNNFVEYIGLTKIENKTVDYDCDSLGYID